MQTIRAAVAVGRPIAIAIPFHFHGLISIPKFAEMSEFE